MRKLIKNIIKKIKNRANRKHYKQLPKKKPTKTKNLHIYGTDFGIIEVEVLKPYTDSNIE